MLSSEFVISSYGYDTQRLAVNRVTTRGARISLFGIRILSVSVYQFSRNCRHAKSHASSVRLTHFQYNSR